MANISSKLVSTKSTESYEINIPESLSTEDVEVLLEHLVKFSVLKTGADAEEIRENIQRNNNRFIFVVSETIVGNNLHPDMFDNIVNIN